MNNNATTTKTTTSEIFKKFKGKTCNVSVEIESLAVMNFDSCNLEFEENDNYKASNGTVYSVYDELTILHGDSESIINLGELEEVFVDESKTKLSFDNDITLTIKII